MVSTMSAVHHIEKLRGLSNYATWKPDMKACLSRDCIWKIISGAEIPATLLAQQTAAFYAHHPEAQKPDGIPDAQFAERNEAAYDAIILGIEKPQKLLIAHCANDGKAAWETLARLYDHPGRLNLKRALYRQTFQAPDEPVASYIARKRELIARLNALGCEVSEVEAADTVLMDLRPEWDTWANDLASRGAYTLSSLEGGLIAEESRRREFAAAAAAASTSNGGAAAAPAPPPPAATPAKRKTEDTTDTSPTAGALTATTGAKKPRTASTPRSAGRKNPRQLHSSTSTDNSTPTTNGHPPAPAPRPFQCLFSFSGCRQLFGSKNEWKRHINHIHLQLWYWRCDFPSCANRKAFFNRKDLFGQHLKRMHPDDNPATAAIQERCRKERRKPPDSSKCGFCGRGFQGQGSWEACVDHVGEHYAGGKGETWELDEGFVEWAVREGVVTRTEDGGWTNAAPVGSGPAPE